MFCCGGITTTDPVPVTATDSDVPQPVRERVHPIAQNESAPFTFAHPRAEVRALPVDAHPRVAEVRELPVDAPPRVAEVR